MAAANLTLIEPPRIPPEPEGGDLGQKQKTRVRSAWISFASRILAQLIGAIATIGLGVVVMQRYAAPPESPAPTGAPPASADAPAIPASAVVASQEIVLAVLPLTNLSGDRQYDALADGLTEALIAELTQNTTWRVISRTTSMQYKQSSNSLPAIARELKAGFVIEGAVLIDGGRLRAVVQLIDAATDHHVWARSYDRPMGNRLDIEADIVAAAAADLRQWVAVR